MKSMITMLSVRARSTFLYACVAVFVTLGAGTGCNDSNSKTVEEVVEETELTAEQIELVQTSWAKVVPIKDAASDIFYDTLLFEDEEMQELFKDTNMGMQKTVLMDTLGVAVDGLSDLETLVPVLEDLGARHALYGVKYEHFDKVGAALLSTLEVGLGDDFTDPVREAWTAVYGVVAENMIRGGGFEPES